MVMDKWIDKAHAYEQLFVTLTKLNYGMYFILPECGNISKNDISILQLVNLKYPSAVLAGQEVEVVPTKVLKVDLPSRRVITVIAHKGRTLREVLRPRLNKYGFKLELITIWGEGHPVSLDTPAINAPTRLVLTSNSAGMRDLLILNLLLFIFQWQSHKPKIQQFQIKKQTLRESYVKISVFLIAYIPELAVDPKKNIYIYVVLTFDTKTVLACQISA